MTIKIVLSFYNQYIAPKLNQLNAIKKIVFNLDASDDDIKNISLKLKYVMLQVLSEHHTEMVEIQLNISKDIPDDIFQIMIALYDEDEIIIKDLSSMLCDNIVKIFDKVVFLNLNINEIHNKLKEC